MSPGSTPEPAIGLFEGVDRLVDVRSGQCFELRTVQAHLGLAAFDQHRYDGRGVERQRLLGGDHIVSQLDHGGESRRGVGQCRDVEIEHHDDVVEEGFVEIDTAETVEPDGLADHGVVRRLDPPDERGVEGAAAEIEDCRQLTHIETTVLGGESGGGFGFGDQLDRVDAGEGCGLAQPSPTMLAPGGGIRQRHPVRSGAELLTRARQHVVEQLRHQPLGGNRPSTDQQRGVVSHPALELSGDAAGFGRPRRCAASPTRMRSPVMATTDGMSWPSRPSDNMLTEFESRVAAEVTHVPRSTPSQ